MSSNDVSITLEGIKEVDKRFANLKRYAVKVANAPVPTVVGQAAVNSSVEQARKFFKTPANRPHSPLRWKSRKQQIAVIIKLKEEGNLPYQRTGKLSNAWSAEVKTNAIEISNDAKDRSGVFYAPFVIAAFQQPFHADTGWPKGNAQIEKQILKPITDDLLKRAKEGIERSKNGG